MTSNVEHEFFKTSEHSSQVTRLQGFEGYMVTELQNPPHILPYLTMTTLHWLKKIVPINKVDLCVEIAAFQIPLVPGFWL